MPKPSASPASSARTTSSWAHARRAVAVRAVGGARALGAPGLLLAFVLMLGPVLLAGSRAGWLCYALVALGFAWREARSPRRFAACARSLGVLLLALAGGLAWNTSARFHDRMERTLAVFNGTASPRHRAHRPPRRSGTPACA